MPVIAWVMLIALSLSGCSKLSTVALQLSTNPSANRNSDVTPADKTILVAWLANHEKSVNSAGGGYRVYYSTQSGFAISGAASVSVPYVSGATAPTTATIPVPRSGTYYIKVVAYSSFNPTGVASTETSAVVP